MNKEKMVINLNKDFIIGFGVCFILWITVMMVSIINKLGTIN